MTRAWGFWHLWVISSLICSKRGTSQISGIGKGWREVPVITDDWSISNLSQLLHRRVKLVLICCLKYYVTSKQSILTRMDQEHPFPALLWNNKTLFFTTRTTFSVPSQQRFQMNWEEGRADMNCSIHLNWLVDDLLCNLPILETKVWKSEVKLTEWEVYVHVWEEKGLICLHGEGNGGWQAASLNLHLFLFYSTCNWVTKVATISRTSTTLKTGHNTACHTQTNELWEISGFWDSCTDKHHLPQVPLIMALWWNQPSSSLCPYEPD